MTVLTWVHVKCHKEMTVNLRNNVAPRIHFYLYRAKSEQKSSQNISIYIIDFRLYRLVGDMHLAITGLWKHVNKTFLLKQRYQKSRHAE